MNWISSKCPGKYSFFVVHIEYSLTLTVASCVCVKLHVSKVLGISKTGNRFMNYSIILRLVHWFGVGALNFRDSEYLLEFGITCDG